MKTALSLEQLIQKVNTQAVNKVDYIADTRTVKMTPDLKLEVQNGETHEYSVTQHTHRQIGTKLEIPAKYYDKMKEQQPELLAANVNTWFEQKPERRMIRTLDGNARAFLSDKYRRLDNIDLMQNVMPTLIDLAEKNGGDAVQFVSSDITDTKLYLKMLFPKIEGEIKRGDVVQSGIVISNSEIGSGAISIEPLVYRLVCTNGMISSDYGQRKNHVGRAGDDSELVTILSDATLEADDKAFWMKVDDIVKATASEATFSKIVEKMRESTQDAEIVDPVRAVEVLQNTYQLTDGETVGVRNRLIKDGDFSRFGMLNAVTRFSQDIEDYDRATDFEKLGGKILNFTPKQWDSIAGITSKKASIVVGADIKGLFDN